jgi:hypothetical protein
MSSSNEVQAISYQHPDGSGRNIIFVEMPGLDDTRNTDCEAFVAIADWLTAM